MSIWEESTKYLAGNKQTKKVYFPCLPGFRVCTWEGKVKGMCRRLEQDGWEYGGVKTAAWKDLAWCFGLQAPTISAPISDSYYADVINSPMATSLTCGRWEIGTCNMALPSAVRPKAGDGGPTGAAVSLPLLTAFQSRLSIFHVLICYPCVLRWAGSQGQPAGERCGLRMKLLKFFFFPLIFLANENLFIMMKFKHIKVKRFVTLKLGFISIKSSEIVLSQ